MLLASGARAEAAELIAPITEPRPGLRTAGQPDAAGRGVRDGARDRARCRACRGTAVQSRCFRSPARQWCPAWPSRSRARSRIISACWPRTLARPAEAMAHLEQAIATHERLGAVTWALRSRYQLTRLQLDDPARRDAAVATLTDVASEAHRIGMAQLARDAEQATLRRRPGAGQQRGVHPRRRAVDAQLRRPDGADAGRQGPGRPGGAAGLTGPRGPRRRPGRGPRRR